MYRIISYESDGTIKVIRNERISNNNPYMNEDENTFSWDIVDSEYKNTASGIMGTRQNDINSYCNYDIADKKIIMVVMHVEI